jgi:hypothetical protein
MKNEDKVAANHRKVIWIAVGFAILVVALAILYEGSQPKLPTFKSIVVLTPNPTVLAADYQKALENIKEGNLRMALVRFEYILAYNKDYPGAAEKLDSIRATLNAAPTGPAATSEYATIAPPEEIDPHSGMPITATPIMYSTNTPVKILINIKSP